MTSGNPFADLLSAAHTATAGGGAPCEGTVLSSKPIRVRGCGQDLDHGDLLFLSGIVKDLKAGQRLLLLPAEDGQIFYVLGRLE